MTDDALFESRKQKEIAELRVRASGAMAHEAYHWLDEADRRLKLGGRFNFEQADDAIRRAAMIIQSAEKNS
jgi:uncharacterized protein (UPF0548 family)